MHRIELELSTVTPAFIGTSDPEKRAEWTAKSVRGQLRWWLRAVLGGEPGGQDKVREVEEAIFGSTRRRSAVRIMVRPFEAAGARDVAEGSPLNETELMTAWGTSAPAVRARLRLNNRGSNPIAYLGYGPIIHDREKKASVYARARIRPPQKLHLLVQWNKAFAPHLDSLRKAMWCWVNLGGIGGRSRRGLGSLVLSRIVAGTEALIEPIETLNTFAEELERHARTAIAAAPIAEWSHFTSETQIHVSTKPYRNWQEALTAAGAWLIAFRRRYGLSSDERPQVRNRDYVWLNSPSPTDGVPDRAGFGMPLPFGRGDLVAGWRRGSERSEAGRRGSPLLIHVARFGNDHHLVFTYMPARLVPKDATIRFHGAQSEPTPGQTGIVPAFLDDLASAAKKKIRRIL